MNTYESFPGDPAAPHLVFVVLRRSEAMDNRLFAIANGAPFTVVPLGASPDVLANVAECPHSVVAAWGKRATMHDVQPFTDLCAVFGKQLDCLVDSEGYVPANPLYTGTGPLVCIRRWVQ